jgi:hypothetical protein
VINDQANGEPGHLRSDGAGGHRPLRRPNDLFAPHLAAEFRAQPTGPHSLELQRALRVLRGAPVAGKHILIFDKASRRYLLGQLPGKRGEPVVRHDEQAFASIEEAEWFVFRLRWRAHTGQELPE